MNVFSKLTIAAAIAAASPLALAQDKGQDKAHAGHGAHAAHAAHGAQPAAASAELTDGEVKKIDKDAGKITLRHGELKNLGMPAMSMVFRVKDATMLDQVKAGDKIRFAADPVNGAVTVVQLQAAQ